MIFAVFVACGVLVVGSLISMGVAFGRPTEGSPDWAMPRPRRIAKWGGLGASGLLLAVVLFFGVFMPGIVRSRIVEAEEITRNTFRQKLGREPDAIRFEAVDRATGWDGWKYEGTAHLGAEVWDVTVTRSNDHSARQTRLLFEATPRK